MAQKDQRDFSPVVRQASHAQDTSPFVHQSSVELTELLQAPACITNAQGHILHANLAWDTLAGRSGTGATPPTWEDLIQPGEYASFLALTSGGAAPPAAGIETLLRTATGASRWYLLHAYPLSAGEHDEGTCLWTGMDIHQRKLKRLVQERLSSLQTTMLDVTDDCVKLLAVDGTLLHMNKAGCRALGVPEDSRFGMSWLSLLPESAHADALQALQSAARGEPSRLFGCMIGHDKQVHAWDSTLVMLEDSDPGHPAIVCVSRDVTAERNALDSLNSTRQRLEVAAQFGGLGIWDYDIVNNKLHCDYTWHRIMGLDPSRPVSTPEEFNPFIHPDDRARASEVTRTAAALISTGRDYAIVFRIIRPNGELRWVRSAAYLHLEEGSPIRATGFVMDITDAMLADATRNPQAPAVAGDGI